MKKTANITKRLLQLLVLFQLLLTADQALAQNLTIKGRVLKDDGQPAQSASVLLKGTNTGTTTNQNGEFTLSAPSNGTLIISTVDFITQEVAVNGFPPPVVWVKWLWWDMAPSVKEMLRVPLSR